MIDLEKRIFFKIGQQELFNRFIEDRRAEIRIKNQIFNVVSRFKTGLDTESLYKIPHWIYAESQKNGLDPLFLTALIVAESSFNNWARSNRGALGLMQIKPRTAHAMASETQIRWEGKPTLFKPDANIALGAYYLNKLMSRFGDAKLALEAYNHGPSRLKKYLRRGKPPTKYSSKVFQIYDMIRIPSV